MELGYVLLFTAALYNIKKVLDCAYTYSINKIGLFLVLAISIFSFFLI